VMQDLGEDKPHPEKDVAGPHPELGPAETAGAVLISDEAGAGASGG